MVEKISLPTPKLESNNLDKPNKSTYKILALYDGDSFNYDVNMYEDICVLQRINIVPNKDMAGEY